MHGEAGVSLTYGDLDGYLDVVRQLAREIDDAVARRVQVIARTGTLPW
ncbi:MAG: hypothetical protein JWP14_494 [Frankiales bacterium]|jgi:hypothetical protein|nr:hypothetical protein [Frankiales bacterium]